MQLHLTGGASLKARSMNWSASLGLLTALSRPLTDL